jgi:TM2 domain-containing membrane protein YozV
MIRACALIVGGIALASLRVGAQPPRTGAPARGASSSPARALCPAVRTASPPTDSQRLAARALVQRAQQAAILGDRASAREQWRQAAALDPTDADLAYQLARAHDGAGASADAATEYCRFLALAPNAPEAAEARERVAILSPLSRAPAAEAPPSLPSPGRALALGLIVPGAGQFYTGRPLRGTIALAAAGVAIGVGVRTRTTMQSEQQTALDPFGNPYTFTTTRTSSSRPWLAPALATAGAIAIASAIEAFDYTRHMNDDRRLALDLVPVRNALALRFIVR